MRKPCTPKKIYIGYSVGSFKSTCLGIMNELDRGNPTCIKQGRSFIIKQGLYMYLRFSGKFTPKKKYEKINPQFNLVIEDTDWILNTECQSSPDPLAR